MNIGGVCVCFQIMIFSRYMPRSGITVPGGSDSKESVCNAGDPGSILGQEDPLEKEVVTHSSILSWRIPQTEESGVS